MAKVREEAWRDPGVATRDELVEMLAVERGRRAKAKARAAAANMNLADSDSQVIRLRRDLSTLLMALDGLRMATDHIKRGHAQAHEDRLKRLAQRPGLDVTVVPRADGTAPGASNPINLGEKTDGPVAKG